MKKVFKLDELDCANCAAKMENAINKLDGVEKATVNFMMKKLTIVADESVMEKVVDEAQRAIKKIEPDCVIVR
ncbi:MAG: cation transporter [Acutalibacteraceae bacterium]